MLESLLVTKLYIPPSMPGWVVRERLLEQLDSGVGRKLTLVSAPAGFGKTTLVSEWAHRCRRPVAWLSIDNGESDLTRFSEHLIAAIQTVNHGIGLASMAALQTPQQPPIEHILTGLLNEIAASSEQFILVLDDYHLADSTAVNQAVAFLIEHLPPQLHLVIVTREDPDLPLARLRARGQLSEVRAADLRFTADEATEFLNGIMALGLTPDDIKALESRTEGWIAGLQLAALSMQRHDDIGSFIQTFTGSHRFVLDYLVEEVLQRQPEHIQAFLLGTSILERFCAPLCDAVIGQHDSASLLNEIERENLFLVPLDDNRQWFRYHHLFAEVMYARAQQVDSGEISSRHRRASEWFEHHGFLDDAIRHAVAAGDADRAAHLIEQVARSMLISRHETTLLGWLDMLPDPVIRNRPVLSTYLALAIVSFDLDAAEVRLQDAEHALDRFSEGVDLPVSDKESLPSLRGIIEITRAYHSGATGDTDGIIAHALKAVEVLPEDDHLWRGAVSALLGLAYWHRGELDAAHRSFADSERALRMIGDITQSISAALIRSNIAVVQGRLRMAEKICLDMVEQVIRYSQSPSPPIADLHVGVSEIKREHNDLSSAADHLATSEMLGERSGIAEYQHRWFIADARLREARGDLTGALESLDEAERLYLPSPDPDVRPFAAMKARIWIKQDQIGEALRWAQEQGLTIHDDLTYLREYEHITLARLLIAQHRNEKRDESIRDAETLLERLAQAAEAGGRYGSLIEILVLQAIASEAQGEVAAALDHLRRAMELAEPEGYVRTFIDEGEPVGRLLKTAISEGIMPNCAQAFLTALEGASPESAPPGDSHPLAEPLTARELEVLQLIAQGLSNRQICNRLFLSLNTVKGHNRVIFSKLQVQRRTEAVARARELGLI